MTAAGGYLIPVLDVIVIALLGATIWFAIRLSAHLKDFRAGRKDLEKLVRDMAAHIDKAEKAIEGLREGARESGRDLQARINEARALVGDLQHLAGQAGSNAASPRAPQKPFRPAAESFAIRDPELERFDESGETGIFSGEEGEEEEFHSRAERDLYEALKGGRRKAGAGGLP